MSYIENEIAEVSRRLNLATAQISEKDANTLRNKLSIIYQSFWEINECKNYESVCDSTAWRWLPDLIGDESVYLFFPEETDESVWQVAGGKNLVSILEDSFGFVFYVSPLDLRYLLFYDDHDCLIGTGDAVDWIKQKRSERLNEQR